MSDLSTTFNRMIDFPPIGRKLPINKSPLINNNKINRIELLISLINVDQVEKISIERVLYEVGVDNLIDVIRRFVNIFNTSAYSKQLLIEFFINRIGVFSIFKHKHISLIYLYDL